MYSFKKITALLLCIALVFAFSGCKDSKKDSGNKNKKPVSSAVSGNESQNQDVSDNQTSSDNISSDISSDNSLDDTSSFEQQENNFTDNTDSSEVDTNSQNGTDNQNSSQQTQSDTQSDDSYQTDRYIPTVEDVKEIPDEADNEHKTKLADWDGPKDYVIVVPKGNEMCKESAIILKNWFKKNAKTDLKIVDDTVKAQKKEILIGQTNRYSYKLKEGEYFAKNSNGKLIFGGGHNVTVKKAVEIYTRMKYCKGKTYTFSGKSDFVGNKLGYTYVWGDEFEGNDLDMVRWNRSTKMGATAEATLDNTKLTTKTENGYLKMFALRYWDPKKSGVEFVMPWSVTTMETMSYRYGYVEIRAKVPFIRGVWPSFWTSSAGALNNDYTQKYGYSTEIDVFEVFSSLDRLSPNIHKWYGDGRHTMWAIDQGNSNEWYQFQSDNLVNEYHTYGFEWTPTKITMYIDGKDYYTYDLTINFDDGETGMGGFEAPIYLIFNNHLFTDSSDYKPYAGCEIHAPDLPAEYFIDWVRLYQKNDGKSQLNLAGK